MKSINSTVELHNGVEMPVLGLGVFQSKDGEEVVNAIHSALDVGYRSIDTASIYGNEKGVGTAIESCAVPRSDIFITSKVWNADQGYKQTLKAYEESLNRLKLDYLDLYLIHWPVKGLYLETWNAFEDLYNAGKVRSIGVSNFLVSHLDDLTKDCRIIPMVNQIEFHPYLVQQPLIDYCKSKEIVPEAWSPIMKGKAGEVPVLNEIAAKYGKTAEQVVLRWDLQKGVVTIPKSVKPERIKANSEIFDFKLSIGEINQIDKLDQNKRFGPDPSNFNF